MPKTEAFREAENRSIARPANGARRTSAEQGQGAILDQKQTLLIAPPPQFLHWLLPTEVMDEINRPGAFGLPGHQVCQVNFTSPGNLIPHHPRPGGLQRVDLGSTVIG